MTGSGNIEPAPRPPHVPPDLVVDFDYRNFPGHDSDVHLAWKRLHQGPDLFWSPRHGGYWVATLHFGRYIDRFERRNGRWAIAARACVIEWHAALGSLPMPPEALAAYAAVGPTTRDRTDKSYQRPLQVRGAAG
jgi:hypothetical protein